ncbi:PAS domain S-box protein [Methylomonas sp. AM2-LC]|uniref:PAS domain S-box protein n=1 Tax=Methylomonas sp. AM2-LC TaxID=3153301 RepID=UPI003266DE4E
MQPKITYRRITIFVIAVIIPVIATMLQLWLMHFIPHTTWLLLYPAVFISAWLGGVWGGIVASIFAALLGVYFFIPPFHSFQLSDPNYAYSIVLFIVMGVFFGLIFEKLKRSENALQKLAAIQIKSDQERLAMVLASSQAGLWEWSLADNRVTWSDTLRKLYGLDMTTPSSYDNWLATIYAEDQASVEQELLDAVNKGHEFSLEWRVANRPENQQQWLMSNGKPVRDKKDNILFYRGIVLDITQRRRQELAISNSEREFRLLADAMPQIVWIADTNGLNTFFNQQWVDYTGLSFEESFGHGWNIPFHPEDQQLAWEAWQKAVHSHAVYSRECRLRRFDGEYRWWLIRGVPIKNEEGQIGKWFGTCTDIHDLKLTQASLKKSENRYRQLFEANPLPLWIYDTETLAFLDVNVAAIANYGYSRNEFLAMTITDIDQQKVVDLEKKADDGASSMSNVQLDGKTVVCRQRRKDGGYFWAELTGHHLPLEESPAAIVLARDLTEQRQVEQKLQDSEARW